MTNNEFKLDFQFFDQNKTSTHLVSGNGLARLQIGINECVLKRIIENSSEKRLRYFCIDL